MSLGGFTVLLVNSFLSGFPGGKDVSIHLRNLLPTFVLTAAFHGGLKHVTGRVPEFFFLLLCVVFKRIRVIRKLIGIGIIKSTICFGIN